MATHDLKYCQQQTKRLQVMRFSLCYAKLALPLLAAALVILYAIKWFYPIWLNVIWSVPIILVSLFIIIFYQGQWRLSSWKVAAFIDQQAGVNGRFMYAVETGNQTQLPQPLPDIHFPQIITNKIWFAWLLLIGGFLLWFKLPVMPPKTTQYPIVAQPVKEMQQLLNKLDKVQAPTFVEQVEIALSRMQQRTQGLTPEDFQALSMMREQTLEQLKNQQQNLQSQQKLTQALDHTLDQLQTGKPLDKQQWEQLANEADALSQQLQSKQASGKHSQLAKQLAQMARKQSQGTQKQGTQNNGGQGQPGQTAQQRALKSLREQLKGIGKQGQSTASGNTGQQGQGAIKRGPGEAPLNFTQTPTTGQVTYKNQTFKNKGKATISLGEITRHMPESAIVEQHGQANTIFQSGTNTAFSARQYRPKHQKILEAYFDHE